MTQAEFDELKQNEDNHETNSRCSLTLIQFIDGMLEGNIPLKQINMKGDRVLVTQLPQKVGVMPMKKIFKWFLELNVERAVEFYHNKVYKSTYKYRPYVVRNRKKIADRENKKREASQD